MPEDGRVRPAVPSFPALPRASNCGEGGLGGGEELPGRGWEFWKFIG